MRPPGTGPAVRRSYVVLLLAGVLLGALAACSEPPAPPPGPGVDARHYDLSVRLDPPSRRLSARAVLEVYRPDTLAALTLAFGGLTVDSVRVDGRVVEARRTREGLVVPLPPGRAVTRIDVAYHGVPREGLHAVPHDGQVVLFTDAWPDAGRGWLPGVHHPADPATLTLALILPPGYEAVASGTLQAVDTLDGALRYRWRLGVPAPTYAFAFAVADFSVTESTGNGGVAVRSYLLAEDSARAGVLVRTEDALAFFADLIGPYPYAQYAAVQVPLRYAGMENASAAFLQADLFHGGDAEAVQVHELAHQWFGNRVSLAGWHDLWLSEGMATYLTTLFYAHADGPEAARTRWTSLAVLTPDRRRTHAALVPPRPIDPEALLTWIPYDKGACVLHLLRLTLGDEAFFAALRDVYRRHAGRPLSTEAFRAALEAAAGRDLGGFFEVWVHGDALPVLRTTWTPETRTLTWQITGDGGTLAGVPFELGLRQRSRVRYVDAGMGRAVLEGWGVASPAVQPVGVLLHVQ